jgi:WD40 repeat protein
MSAITPHKKMRGHTSIVSGVAHLPGGQRIITCTLDGSLRLWDLESSAQIGGEWREEWDGMPVRMVALSPNGKTLANISQAGTVRVWDIETGKVITKWEAHTYFARLICWSPDSERVASGFSDGTVWVLDVKTGEPVKGLNPIKTGFEQVYAVSYSPEATMIATGGDPKQEIEIWDAKTGKLLSTILIEDVDWTVWSLTWTLDKKKLIAGMSNGLIRIFDTDTLQEIAVLDEHKAGVYSLTLLRNDRLLASTSWDRTARLWNLYTNLPVGPPLQHDHFVQSAAFSADGKLLSTSCFADKNAYIWDVQAILTTADLENLLFIPHVQKSELNKETLSGVNATRRPPIRPASRQVPAGFFDNVQGRDLMLPTVSILISLYVAAILLHYPGGRVHVRSSLAFLNSSAMPKPTLMNQLNLSNAQGPLPPLVVVFLLSKFLH